MSHYLLYEGAQSAIGNANKSLVKMPQITIKTVCEEYILAEKLYYLYYCVCTISFRNALAGNPKT
mgnify:FL=1